MPDRTQIGRKDLVWLIVLLPLVREGLEGCTLVEHTAETSWAW